MALSYIIIALLIPGLLVLLYEIVTLKFIENPDYRKVMARVLYIILAVIVINTLVKEITNL